MDVIKVHNENHYEIDVNVMREEITCPFDKKTRFRKKGVDIFLIQKL